jgi:hypothetical protein
MFDVQVQMEKRINPPYDEVAHHYHVKVNITRAMARRYVCKGSNNGFQKVVTHKCEQACRDCIYDPSCVSSDVQIPCESCNRNFSSRTCFDKYKNNKLRVKTVCEQKKNCVSYGSSLTNVLKSTV